MKARLKDVPVGVRFDTLLTGRRGVVRAHNGPEVLVLFDTEVEERGLAREVVVDAEEVSH